MREQAPGRDAAPVAVSWECLTNTADDAHFRAVLELTNVSQQEIAPGWTVSFNACRKALAETVTPGYAIEHVNGDLFRLTMPGGGAWLPGQRHRIEYDSLYWAISVTDAPLGFYLEPGDGAAPIDLGDPVILPFASPAQRMRSSLDALPTEDAARRHARNADLRALPESEIGRITPRPRQARLEAGRCLLGARSSIVYRSALVQEAAYLAAVLEALPGAEGSTVELAIGEVEEAGAEAYELEISQERVKVRGASAHGVFNGIQSLVQLLEPDGSLPLGSVRDAPRFAYRGMMLDVARHFASVDTVLRLLDCMASYKLNRFHFHLTDDEGWRLAISGLPELTEIGARRGVAGDGQPCLPPSFGSGAQVDGSAGTGHYSALDFVAILRHAHARHIEVIPEFNMPGHARAAVVAMKLRHDRLLAAGDAEGAERYLLSDLEDRSVYESVQMWHDNVICIALPSVDRFIETVVAEVCALYRVAGAPLRVIHTGGDEVPAGAWLGSPRCRAKMAEQGWTSVAQLHGDFVARCRAILARHGVEFAGWEETALVEQEGAGMRPNPRFAAPDFHVYVWNNAWGSGQEDCAYRLANAGYDVVLANAANLYFDLAYAKHPEEPGYYWAGFVETRHAFAFCPFDAGATADLDPMGRPLDPALLRSMQPLEGAGHGRIAGLQGQLWGENARSPARIDYLALPRLIALAERAWAPDPGWQGIADLEERAAAVERDWNEFAHRLGLRELPRLDRAPTPYGYRLPPPGVLLKDGAAHANVALPGLALHYTVDGSEPHAAGPRYANPVPLPNGARFRIASFDTRGRRSRIVSLTQDSP